MFMEAAMKFFLRFLFPHLAILSIYHAVFYFFFFLRIAGQKRRNYYYIFFFIPWKKQASKSHDMQVTINHLLAPKTDMNMNI